VSKVFGRQGRGNCGRQAVRQAHGRGRGWGLGEAIKDAAYRRDVMMVMVVRIFMRDGEGPE
jgi:hypothetical protein